MRTLNYLLLGFTPMLVSVTFAQALNTGMKEGMTVQAQYGGGSMGGRDSMGGQRPGSDTDPMNAGKSGDPMTTDKDKDQPRSGYTMPGRSADKQDPSKDRSSQARKGKKDEPKPTGE